MGPSLVDIDIAGHEVFCLTIAGPRYQRFQHRGLFAKGEQAFAVVLWGGNYLVIRLALREIPVLNFAFLRFFLGAALLCAWSHAVGDLLALGAAAAWVWYSLAISPVVGSPGAWQATACALGIATLAFAPLALFEAAHHVWWRSTS